MRNRTLALALAAASLMAACGDSTGPEASGPTAAQLRDLMSAVSSAGQLVQASEHGTNSARALSASSVDNRIGTTRTVSCPVSGTVTGTIVAPQSTEVAAVDVKYSDCRAAGETGTVWTLNGNPSLRFGFVAPQSGSSINSTVNVKGGLRFDGDGTNGACQFDFKVVTTIQVSSTTAGFSGTVRVVGTGCGQTVDETHPFP